MMVSENPDPISDPEDPLQAYSGLSLFPRTIRAFTDAPLPSDPNDLDSIHNFIKSTKGISSPGRVMDEGKAIVDGAAELLNSKFGRFLESFGIDEGAIAPQGKKKGQERRQGLGRKRARFSMKPTTSQPAEILEPSLNIDQLQDPEEFFSTFEKLENAKREMQKQKGGTTSDTNEYNPTANTRHRRPGILGKSARYKHRYSSVILESNDMLISSQETLEQDVLDAPGYVKSQQETTGTNDENEETDVAGSITRTENRMNELLDELLSKASEDLDGDRAFSLLQERLKIKPMDLGNLSIPDFHDIGKTDFKALGEKLPMTRKSLSNISNLPNKLGRETPTPKKHKQVAEGPLNPITSPMPSKSPFASISLLKKLSLQSNPLRDPFSPCNVDFSEPRNSFSGEDIEKQADQCDVLKELSMSGRSRSPSHVEVDVIRSTGSHLDTQMVATQGSDNLTDDSMDNNLGQKMIDVDVRSTGADQSDVLKELSMSGRSRSHVGVDVIRSTVSDLDTQTVVTQGSDNLTDNSVDKNLGQKMIDVDVRSSGSQVHLGELGSGDELQGNTMEYDTARDTERIDRAAKNVGSMLNVAGSSRETQTDADFAKSGSGTDVHIHQSSQMEENVGDMQLKAMFPAHQHANLEKSRILKNMNESQHSLDCVTLAATEENHVDMPSRTEEIDAAKNPEKQYPSEKQKSREKRPRAESREIRGLRPRPSLAAAGTSFESGVRRSKRIKTRPLEYWKGERLLYGRLNDSLKLIGLKYISPAKGDGKLQVKSYISDEYNGILEQAALH